MSLAIDLVSFVSRRIVDGVDPYEVAASPPRHACAPGRRSHRDKLFFLMPYNEVRTHLALAKGALNGLRGLP